MTKVDKLIVRLLSRPADFTWEELQRILSHFGYEAIRRGKTGGSRRKFVDKDKGLIILHQPHPGSILKRYQLDHVIDTLTQKGKL